MRKTIYLQAVGLCLLGGSALITGCKPELTSAAAQSLIQAEYDHRPAANMSITLDETGIRQGIAAKYWTPTTLYPNKYWADFTLTPEGKKVVKLPGGGDVIQWRPESATDKRYTTVIATVATTHAKAKELRDIQEEVGGGRSVQFSETLGLDALPQTLQTMAHNAANRLSTRHQADFVVEGGAWKLKSIE